MTLPKAAIEAAQKAAAEKWPETKLAIFRAITAENLNDGHYINAYDLTEKVYAAFLAQTAPVGWLFFNPDAGVEFNENHPVESGEVPDAENIRQATAENLLDELLAAWEGLDEERKLRLECQALAAAPVPPANSQGSLDGSEPMMTDEEFKQLVAEVGHPEDTLPYLRVPSPAADPVKAQLVEALKASDTALADWLHIYADDMCDEPDVEASKARIAKAGSTLAYLSDLFEMNRAAIDAAEKEASSQSPLGWPAPAPVDKIVAALSDAEDAKE